MILGHESAGIVAEIGSKVKNVKVGDKVAMEPQDLVDSTASKTSGLTC